MRKTLGFLALVALSTSLVGCGRNSVGQVALPTQAGQTSWAGSTAPRANYPMPTVQTNGTAQAVPGGRAVATAGGYVYEQSPTATAAGYNYYNTQNPCLYPRPGQTASCGTGTAGYYAGQTRTGYPTTTAYPTTTGYPAASAYGSTNPYGTATPAYGATSPYGTAPAYGSTNPYGTTPAYGTTNPYGTGAATTNPYGTTPAYGSTNPYGTGTATTNPYGTAPAATNPYGTGVGTPSTYTGQSAPTGTSADRARSRIDTSSASTGSTGTGKKGPSF